MLGFFVVISEVAFVAEAHGLSSAQQERLRRIAVGAVPGNRDRPFFMLARDVLQAGHDDLLEMMLPQSSHLSQAQAALLDFLFSAALEDQGLTACLIGALPKALNNENPIRFLTREFVSVVQDWRRRRLPLTQHQNVFTAVRRFLRQCRPDDPFPRDGDALNFWRVEGTRNLMTRYTTAFRALADYAEAAWLLKTWDEIRPADEEAFERLAAQSTDAGVEEDLMEPGRLGAVLQVLEKQPIKVLLSHELDSFARLATYGDVVRRFPGDTFAALNLGPVQSNVIQALRRGGEVGSSDEFVVMAKSFDEMWRDHAELDEALVAALHMVARKIGFSSKMQLNRSSRSISIEKRIAVLERRQSIATLSVEERPDDLRALMEPLVTLKALMERYLGAWETLGASRGAELERGQRVLFQEKLNALYHLDVSRA